MRGLGRPRHAVVRAARCRGPSACRPATPPVREVACGKGDPAWTAALPRPSPSCRPICCPEHRADAPTADPGHGGAVVEHLAASCSSGATGWRPPRCRCPGSSTGRAGPEVARPAPARPSRSATCPASVLPSLNAAPAAARCPSAPAASGPLDVVRRGRLPERIEVAVRGEAMTAVTAWQRQSSSGRSTPGRYGSLAAMSRQPTSMSSWAPLDAHCSRGSSKIRMNARAVDGHHPAQRSRTRSDTQPRTSPSSEGSVPTASRAARSAPTGSTARTRPPRPTRPCCRSSNGKINVSGQAAAPGGAEKGL